MISFVTLFASRFNSRKFAAEKPGPKPFDTKFVSHKFLKRKRAHNYMTVNSGTLDSLAILIQAVAHDPKLRKWFGVLAGKSAVARRNEIFATTRQMTSQGEDPKIISSLFLLTDEKIFDAALQMLRENGHLKE